MQDLTLIGIDLGKHGFYVRGQDRHGKAVLRRKFERKHLIAFFANFRDDRFFRAPPAAGDGA